MRTQALVLALILAGAPHAVAQQASMKAPSECRAVPVNASEGEIWTFSGSFSTPSELVLVDVLNDRLLRFDAGKARYQGPEPGVIEKVVGRAFGEFSPSAIATNYKDQTTWIQLVGGRLLEVKEGNVLASTAKPTQLWGTQLEDNAKLVAVLRWALEGSTLFGYGNFRLANGDLNTGFYAVNLRDTTDAQVIASFPESHEAMTWYRLGYPYIAAVGEEGYVLKVNGALSIGKIVRKEPSGRYTLEHFSALPEELTTAAALPEFTTPEDYVSLMKAIEEMEVPAGLYGWEGHLYLLWRESHDNQQEWWLSKIDPKNGKYLGKAQLPSSANHLMVVPGPRYWALVDRGQIRGLGMQSVKSVTFIPSSEIQNLPSRRTLCQ